MGNIEKFDSIASRYDNEERREVAKAIAERVRALVGDAGAKTAIDFGCGTDLLASSCSMFLVWCSLLMRQQT